MTAALERLQTARATTPDAELERAATETADAAARTDAEVRSLQADLAARDEATVLRRAREVQTALDALVVRRDELDDALVLLEAKLSVMGGEARQEAWDEAESRVQRLAEELAGLERRAAASRLLLRTLDRHRDTQRRRYVQPFTDRWRSWGARCSGRRSPSPSTTTCGSCSARCTGGPSPTSTCRRGPGSSWRCSCASRARRWSTRPTGCPSCSTTPSGTPTPSGCGGSRPCSSTWPPRRRSSCSPRGRGCTPTCRAPSSSGSTTARARTEVQPVGQNSCSCRRIQGLNGPGSAATSARSWARSTQR